MRRTVLLAIAIVATSCNWSLTGTKPPAKYPAGCRNTVVHVYLDSLPKTITVVCHPLSSK